MLLISFFLWVLFSYNSTKGVEVAGKSKPGRPKGYKPKEGENKGGRPSKLDNLNLKQVEFLALRGFTDAEFAEFFEITPTTWNNWKNKNKKFFDTLKLSKEAADRKVERSLWERATGYSHPDVHISNFQGIITETKTIKHYPPDPTSMIFWLKNRQKEKWRDKQEIDYTFKKSVVEKEFDDLLGD